MNNIEYVKSEKIWRAPELEVESSGLGAAILENLKQSDPEKVFEVLHDTGTSVTVKEIRHQTITVAQNLLNLGVKKNDYVVVFSLLNLKITPLTYACFTIGAPVCFFETYTEEEYIPGFLEMLDPTLIIYEEKFESMVFKALEKLNLSHLQHVLSLDGAHKSVDELLFRPAVDIENFQAPDIGDPKAQPAILGFTSGSTGKPKIIINSHAMIRHGVYNQFLVKPGSVVMVLCEPRWCCQVSTIPQPALLDVKRVYTSTPSPMLTGDFAREIIDTHKVTHYFDVPSFCRTLFKAAELSKDPLTLSLLRFISVGGEGVGEALENYVRKITPNCKFDRCYGMTEVGGVIASSELAYKKNVNGGVLKKGFVVKLMNKDKTSLGPNEIGRVYVKTAAPFLGYLKNETGNKETFVEGGWLDTGDLGMMDSDNLLNIYTRENYTLRYADGKILLPNAVKDIVNKFEGVHSSALVGIPRKENPKEDCATIFVVPKNNTYLTNIKNDLVDYLRNELTKDQLRIVKYLKLVGDLPETTCLKTDRLALKGMIGGGYTI